MPNVSILAAYTLYPLTGDYIGAMVIMYSLVMAVFLTVLCYQMYEFLESRNSDKRVSLILTVLWMLIHFTLLIKSDRGNSWIFGSITAACYFYYTIPAIMNEALVLYLLRKRGEEKTSVLRWVVLVVIGYFGVFSNLFPAIILGAYAGVDVLYGFSKGLKQKAYSFYLILLFLISIIFEIFGGRAAGFNTIDLAGTITELTKNVFSYNKLVLSSALVLLILPLLSNKNKAVRESENAESIWIMLVAIPVTLFLILVCAKTGAWYIGRADVHLVLVFYPLLSVFCLATIRLKKDFADSKKVFAVLALAMLLNLIPLTSYNENFYKPSNTIALNPEICKRVGEYIVSQIVEAENQGLKQVDLHVPKFETEDNWPIVKYAGGPQSRFSYTLWRHGLIEDGISINLILDEEKNKEFGIG